MAKRTSRPGIHAKKLRVVPLAPLTAGEIVKAAVLPEVRPQWLEGFYGWVRSLGARLMNAGR